MLARFPQIIFLLFSFALFSANAFSADGDLDLTFSNPGTGVSGIVETMALQSDGKILIGGWFTNFNGIARNGIARLNADGSLDGSFDPGTGASGGAGLVFAMAVQTDGKILIGGYFTSFNGTARNYIARLNIDGSLDSSFNPGTGADSYVRSMAVQTDGKILIGGTFTSFNGTAINRIARLNADGSRDSSFNPGTSADDYVDAMALQTDGKIFIGGNFTSFNGTAISRIARLNADGSRDSSFNPGAGANNYVAAMALQPNGKILIGGAFTLFKGEVRYRIARLEVTPNAVGDPLLMRNPSTGAWQSFLMNNAAVSTSAALSINTSSDYVYQTQLDANGDGTADVLTRRTSDGAWILSTVVNNAVTNTTTLAMLNDPTWQYQASGDFNGDGTDDVLLRNTSTLYWYVFYLKNGVVDSGSFSIAIWNSANDILQGVADFNNDGKADVLMRNTAGLWSVYDFASGVTSGVPGLWMSNSWAFHGLMDFNKDGIKDILLRDTNAGDLNPGVWVAFTLNSSHAVTSAYGLNNVYRNLSVISLANTGDYDGNGTDDLLLRNTSNGAYYMFTTNTPAEASPGLQTLRAAPALNAVPWSVMK